MIALPSVRRTARHLSVGLALGAAPIAAAGAQAWFYPSFQVPRVADRDYNFGVIANNGTSALFQWREGITPSMQLSLDAGLADPDGDDNSKLFVAGQYARELARATADQPLDLLFTAGVGFAIGDGPDLLRIPVGVSVGHRFALDGAMAITPYVHPRASIDFFAGTGNDARDDDDTNLSLDFDVGGSFELTSRLALRAALLFSGARNADDFGFGLSVNWSPAPLARR
jgi:hypothetical protein